MMDSTATVCVVIAARNAAATIGRAVRSALQEKRVSEVLVIDDASSDPTADAAFAADDGSARLRLHRLPDNRGPAFARNHAIAHSSAPMIAVLDADDFFLKGRFDRLLSEGGWDFVADNIVFVDEADAGRTDFQVPRFEAAPRFLDLPGFVDGNISRRGAPRGEIGFLKPVMRRSFLDEHGLRYDEKMRLGEDYDLYARALAKGARFKIVHDCGYGAVVRANSLSGRHRTPDLRHLYEADRAMLALPGLSGEARAALRRHERHIRARYELRRFLDLKAERGLARAGIRALQRPVTLPAIVAGVAADKLDVFKAKMRPSGRKIEPCRYLLEARVVQK